MPEGFCITTEAFGRMMADAPSVGDLLDRLSGLGADDREAIGALSVEVRRVIEGVSIPDDVVAAISGAIAGLGEDVACAVRSSAMAEDLPAASFAGQQDSYLNTRDKPSPRS